MSNTPSASVLRSAVQPSHSLIHTCIFLCLYLARRTYGVNAGDDREFVGKQCEMNTMTQIVLMHPIDYHPLSVEGKSSSRPAATACFRSIILKSLVMWATISLGWQCPKSKLSRWCFISTAAMDRRQLGGHMCPAELEEIILIVSKKDKSCILSMLSML